MQSVCQLRIENDWQEYARRTLLARIGNTEDCPLTAIEVLRKVAAVLGEDHRLLYITCNEDDLPVSASELESEVQAELRYELMWKRDVVDVSSMAEWCYLERAALDFEIAVSASKFFGTTRSTFFNIAALTSFARNGHESARFFAYNVLGGSAVERTDHGAFAGAAEATMPRAAKPLSQHAGVESEGGMPPPVKQGELSLNHGNCDDAPVVSGSTPKLKTFYERYGGTSAKGWSAEFDASLEPNFVRAQESMAEVFGTTSLPLKSTRSYLHYLRRLHEANKSGVYCEIGINHGDSLRLGNEARLSIGVDPLPRIAAGSFEKSPFIIIKETSDRFFIDHAPGLLNDSKIDFTFIDGLHIFEFALRDFIGAEHFSNSGGSILIHDVLPRTEFEAARMRITRSWTGDVWRLIYVLKRFRPGLKLRVIDAQPTGLAMISGLDPDSHILMDQYDEVVRFGLALSSSEMMRSRDEILGVESAVP